MKKETSRKFGFMGIKADAELAAIPISILRSCVAITGGFNPKAPSPPAIYISYLQRLREDKENERHSRQF